MKRIWLVALLLMTFTVIPSAWGESPRNQIFYKKATSLAPGTPTLRFSLWNVESGGDEATNMVWSETKSITLTSSVIKTLLGDTVTIDPGVFAEQLWVQVDKVKRSGSLKTIGARDILLAVPYTARAEHAAEAEQAAVASTVLNNTAGAKSISFGSGAISFTSTVTNITSLTLAAPGPGVITFNVSGLMGLRAHTNGTTDQIRCSISTASTTVQEPYAMVIVPASAPSATGLSHGAPIGLTRVIPVAAAGDVTAYLNCVLTAGGGGSDPFVQYGQMSASYLPTQY